MKCTLAFLKSKKKGKHTKESCRNLVLRKRNL